MTTEKTRKGWLVTWALTKGIVECEFVVDNPRAPTLARKANRYNYHSVSDIFWDRADAVSELNKRIEARRRSIKKELAKLDTLEDAPKFVAESDLWPEQSQ